MTILNPNMTSMASLNLSMKSHIYLFMLCYDS